MISPFHHLPDRALLRTQEEQVPLSSSQLAARRFRDISWELAETTHGLDVSITAQETPLKELVLRWDLDFPQGCRFLGVPWERGYGLPGAAAVLQGAMPRTAPAGPPRVRL